MTTLVSLTFTTVSGTTALTSWNEGHSESWAACPDNGATTAPNATTTGLQLATTGQSAKYYLSRTGWSNTGNADYGVTMRLLWGGQTGDAIIGPSLRTHAGVASGYQWVYRKNDGAMRLLPTAGGQVGSNVSFSPTVGESYDLTVEASGTTISGFVQRVSDSQWLTSSGTWSGTRSATVSGTDSSQTNAWYPGFWAYESSSNLSKITAFNHYDFATGTAPSITSHPGNATVNSPVTATFSVSATGTGTLTYQWQRSTNSGGSWSDISAATSSSYTTPATTVSGGSANNGDQYRCVVTGDTSPSATSNAATLTVNSAAATAVTMTGPATSTVSVSSTAFTVGANGTITGTVAVTPSDGGSGGTFSPTSVSINAGTPTGTFTYTGASTGVKTISATNNGGLTNPSSISHTVNAAGGSSYTAVLTVDSDYADNICVLVPTSYSAGTPAGLVIYCHGQTEAYNDINGSASATKADVVNALTAAGYFVACSNAGGGYSWGNWTSTNSIVAMERWIRANYDISHTVMWGVSMGGIAALNVIASGRIPVIGFIGTAPTYDLTAMHAGAYGGNIDGAYGTSGGWPGKAYGWDPATMPAGHFHGIPMYMWASPGDTTVSKTDHCDALATAAAKVARSVTVTVCSGTHSDPSHFDGTAYLAAVNACFAKVIPLEPPTTTKTVTLTLLDNDGVTPLASTAYSWRWSDNPAPTTPGMWTDMGTGTTNGSGVATITVHSNLTVGQAGRIELATDSGSTGSSWRAVGGPVEVT